jgi:hypothetical protein
MASLNVLVLHKVKYNATLIHEGLTACSSIFQHHLNANKRRQNDSCDDMKRDKLTTIQSSALIPSPILVYPIHNILEEQESS